MYKDVLKYTRTEMAESSGVNVGNDECKIGEQNNANTIIQNLYTIRNEIRNWVLYFIYNPMFRLTICITNT